MSARVEVYREILAGQMNATEIFGHDTARYASANVEGTRLGKWHWRFVKNGRILADSGQGYSRRIDCLNGCATVLGGVTGSDDRDGPTTCIARNDIFGTRVLVPVVDLTREAKP